MAAFKDKKNGSWYVQFRYTDWRGERQQKLKRGFATKKEAQAWEREFLMQKQADVNMSFESFVALYEKDVKPKLKLNTWLSKEHIIRTKILPYFKKRKLSEITARDVIDWQNEIRQHTKSSGESYSSDYLKKERSRMKTVQIPYDLFIDLAMYHLRGEDDYEEEIRQGLEQKLDAMLNRQLYSRYKTAPTKEEREQARQEYLDRRGVPQSYRWTVPPWEL